MISGVSRIGVAATTLSALGLCLAACGGSAAVASKGLLPLTAAQAAYANAVNLRAPDFRGVPGSRSVIPNKIPERGLGRLGLAVARQCEASTITAAAGSPRFVARTYAGTGAILPSYSVQSFVYFAGSPQAALAALNASASLSARRCLRKASSPPVTEIDTGHFSKPPPPLTGISTGGQEMVQVVANLDPLGHDILKYISTDRWFGFTDGSALVVLEDTASPKQFPRTAERRLLSLLYRRAQAYAPG